MEKFTREFIYFEFENGINFSFWILYDDNNDNSVYKEWFYKYFKNLTSEEIIYIYLSIKNKQHCDFVGYLFLNYEDADNVEILDTFEFYSTAVNKYERFMNMSKNASLWDLK